MNKNCIHLTGTILIDCIVGTLEVAVCAEFRMLQDINQLAICVFTKYVYSF